MKRGSARQVVAGKGFRLADEVRYIHDKAADHEWPENRSAFSFSRHSWAMASIPLRFCGALQNRKYAPSSVVDTLYRAFARL
jgi:hypothetical protein